MSKSRNSRVLSWRQCRVCVEVSSEMLRTHRELVHSGQLLKTESSWAILSSVALGMLSMYHVSATRLSRMVRQGCLSLTRSYAGSATYQSPARKTLSTPITTRSSIEPERRESSLVWTFLRKSLKSCLLSRSRGSVYSMIWAKSIGVGRQICWPSWLCPRNDPLKRCSWTRRKSKSTRWFSASPTLTKSTTRRSKRAVSLVPSASVSVSKKSRTRGTLRRKKWKRLLTRRVAKAGWRRQASELIKKPTIDFNQLIKF